MNMHPHVHIHSLPSEGAVASLEAVRRETAQC